MVAVHLVEEARRVGSALADDRVQAAVL